MQYQTVSWGASYCTKELDEEAFDFYSRPQSDAYNTTSAPCSHTTSSPILFQEHIPLSATIALPSHFSLECEGPASPCLPPTPRALGSPSSVVDFRKLGGQKQQKSSEKRTVERVNAWVGELLGKVCRWCGDGVAMV